jgi:hypothetical protein
MKRTYAAAVAAALLALAAHADGRGHPPAGPHHHAGPCCPPCTYGPHKETVKKTVYGTREEPFCLLRVSLFGHFHKGCGNECLTRTKTRLVKWEESEECVRMKCAVQQPAVPTPPPRQ